MVGRTGWMAGGMGGAAMAALLAALALTGTPDAAEARQPRVTLPFAPGETLEFQVRSSRFGTIGTATMAVGPREILLGREVLPLSMETEGRVTLFRFEDLARSWFDPRTLSAVRFEKVERHPLARRNEEVDLVSNPGLWVSMAGEVGRLGDPNPLDELSFIYFIRTMELAPGDVVALDRHFDEARNPVRVRAVKVDTLTVPAGTFPVLVVEMEVRDQERFGNGEGAVIRLHLTRDVRRIPVRVESTAPWVGGLTMDLESMTPGRLPGDDRRSAANR